VTSLPTPNAGLLLPAVQPWARCFVSDGPQFLKAKWPLVTYACMENNYDHMCKAHGGIFCSEKLNGILQSH
jgi:hypothetical protein